jgi:hypothetical protein
MLRQYEYLDHVKIMCRKHDKTYDLKECTFFVDPKYIRMPCGCETRTELPEGEAVILTRRDPDEAMIKLTADLTLRLVDAENRLKIIEKQLKK